MRSLSPQFKSRFLSFGALAYVGLTILGIIYLFQFVNLAPQVDDNFFFSSDDPQFQSERKIDQLFIRKDTQMIISATGNIYDNAYKEKIAALSERLLKISGITSVNSLTHFGPNDVQHALNSPLWKRLIISDDQKSSNLILLLEEAHSSSLIPKIERVMAELNRPDFQLKAAGLPYVLELIRRNLQRDLRLFSSITIIIFGFYIFRLFRSKGLLIGTLLSCTNAVIWTLMVTELMHIPLGILTANLGTIIFVMTLSHIIFLSYNWRTYCQMNDGRDPVASALERTFSPSFWSMCTALLGFASLLTVPAKPLRDLGLAGSVGAIISIMAAYGVFPTFLKISSFRPQEETNNNLQTTIYRFFVSHKDKVVLVILISLALAIPGLYMIDSDPSLLRYFSKKSDIYEGFNYIDRNGGSSPLILVARSSDNKPLNTTEAYNRLWNLQQALEQHRSVGSVISLPVLIAQAKQSALGWIIPQEVLLSIMESPKYDKIANSFVTKDRKCGLFLLRMLERHRDIPRVEVVEELKKIMTVYGFEPYLIGGVYNLQGHLAQLVATSLISGLFILTILFGLISWVFSRSLKMAMAVVGSIAVIPLTVLGLIGIYRIPLDIISAPAINVAIGLGVDAMIHMIKSYKVNHDWDKVCDEMNMPVLTSMVVISTGFAIFTLSTFPPTQRFGGTIVAGTILATLSALFLMPMLHQRLGKNQRGPSI